MYSMPQQAVTNGYWKMENFRAQPIASSRRLVRKDGEFRMGPDLEKDGHGDDGGQEKEDRGGMGDHRAKVRRSGP